MIVLFLVNASRILKIVNFVNSMLLSFNIIFIFLINISIFDIKKEILLNKMIVYKNNIVKKSFINFIEEFSIL